MRGLAQFGHERAMGTPAVEFESPGTKQIGIAVLERGYQGAELRQVLPVLTGVGQPEESMNAHEGRDGTAPTGLSVRQVKQMRARVDFQSHTRFHSILTRCDDVECEQEITGSRRDIERLTGRPCLHFAYPNGTMGKGRSGCCERPAAAPPERATSVETMTRPIRSGCVPSISMTTRRWHGSSRS
jgi:hypothetical protein